MTNATAAADKEFTPRGLAAADALESTIQEGIYDLPSVINSMAPDELEAVGLPRDFLTLTPKERAAAVRSRKGEDVTPEELGRTVPSAAPAASPSALESKIERAESAPANTLAESGTSEATENFTPGADAGVAGFEPSADEKPSAEQLDDQGFTPDGEQKAGAEIVDDGDEQTDEDDDSVG